MKYTKDFMSPQKYEDKLIGTSCTGQLVDPNISANTHVDQATTCLLLFGFGSVVLMGILSGLQRHSAVICAMR